MLGKLIQLPRVPIYRGRLKQVLNCQTILLGVVYMHINLDDLSCRLIIQYRLN